MIRLALPAALLALATPFAFAACGGSDAPTKSEYITKADAICKKADDQITADAEKQFGNKQPTAAQVTQYQKEKVIPALEKESSDLRDLDKPKGDEDELNALYDSLDSAIEKSKSSPTVEDTTFADANKKAKAYGLKECGSDN